MRSTTSLAKRSASFYNFNQLKLFSFTSICNSILFRRFLEKFLIYFSILFLGQWFWWPFPVTLSQEFLGNLWNLVRFGSRNRTSISGRRLCSILSENGKKLDPDIVFLLPCFDHFSSFSSETDWYDFTWNRLNEQSRNNLKLSIDSDFSNRFAYFTASLSSLDGI